MQEILLKDILKDSYQKALKKVTLFLLLNSLPFNGKNCKE